MTEQYTAEMAHAAVKRGAAWLDRRCPDWFKEIDLRALDLGDGNTCVLGQTAECLVPDAFNYKSVVEVVAPVAREAWATRYGFNLPKLAMNPYGERAYREYPIYYEMLTIAWREYIRQRLEAAVS